jgi:hypothetical protein
MIIVSPVPCQPTDLRPHGELGADRLEGGGEARIGRLQEPQELEPEERAVGRGITDLLLAGLPILTRLGGDIEP